MEGSTLSQRLCSVPNSLSILALEVEGTRKALPRTSDSAAKTKLAACTIYLRLVLRCLVLEEAPGPYALLLGLQLCVAHMSSAEAFTPTELLHSSMKQLSNAEAAGRGHTVA